ncbi:MAG: hypothetical protein K940chlam3_00859 [Chlamydiae bacterium]|nr:hypothetical protein [Chlamydiota bacterium]
MEAILTILLEEFFDQLPGKADSVKREMEFPDVPGMINVAIGVRRSGKTYLIYQKIRELLGRGVSREQILFINFEDDRLLPMSQKQLVGLLETFYTLYPENHDRECYLFLDEIQNVDGWPLVVRRFFDTKNVRIYLTGSSAKLLSKEISTSLRGRSISTDVWPYSFREYWEAQGISRARPPIGKKKLDQFYQHLCRYFSIGGFPAIQALHENERRTVLQSYVDAVIFRDVVERYKITNTSLIKYLIKTLIKNVATPFTANKFYRDAKSQGMEIAKDTVYEYLDYIEDAFLIFKVPIFSESIRKMQVNPKKIYIVDNGLVCANRLGISLKMGHLFENQVYLDLRRQGKKIHYYKTEEGYEIDFVAENREGAQELIQVVWDVSDAKTLEREERALLHAERELGIKGRILTPRDYLIESIRS